MANEGQRDLWNAADVAQTWPKTEHVSDQGTPLIMDALRLQSGERVLDVACGGGKTTVAAARAVGPSGHVVGIDIAPRLLDLAQQRRGDAGLANIEFVLCDAQTDPFPSGSFDAVMCQFGIMFFDDPVAALTNIHRYLKPAARAAFIVWQQETSMTWHPVHVVLPYLSVEEDEPPGEANVIERASSWEDPAFVHDVLTSAGFKDVAVEAKNVDVDLPTDTDLPASILTGMVEEADKEALLQAWKRQLRSKITGDVMRLDLKMNLITASA